MGSAIRVAVVDDHPLYREGVIATLKSLQDFQIVGYGACTDDAFRIAREHAPDILLLDIGMPGNGLVAVQKLAGSHPLVKVVVLTVSEDENDVSVAMKAGAMGYILKGVTGRELAQTVREIHQGARYVSPSLAARILGQPSADIVISKKPSGLAELTNRELEIASHVARGLTNKEVGRVLVLSEKTVKHHMTSIMQKLQVRNRSEVVLIASGSGGRGAAHRPQ